MSAISVPLSSSLGTFSLTNHAVARMASRSISRAAIASTLEFGRCLDVREAQVFAIGRKEVENWHREGIDLDDFEGMQVVVTPQGTVLTAYRNSDFRGLRPRRRRSSRR